MPTDKIMSIIEMAVAMSELNYKFSERPVIHKAASQAPEWQRKKCKSCRKCGSYCHKYRLSKPTHKACELYCKK